MVNNIKKLFLLLATILGCVAADENGWKLWNLRASSESIVEKGKEIFQDFIHSEDVPTAVDISNKVTLPTDHQDEDPTTSVMNDVSSNQKKGVRLLKKKGKRGKRARGPTAPGQRRKKNKRNRKLNKNADN